MHQGERARRRGDANCSVYDRGAMNRDDQGVSACRQNGAEQRCREEPPGAGRRSVQPMAEPVCSASTAFSTAVVSGPSPAEAESDYQQRWQHLRSRSARLDAQNHRTPAATTSGSISTTDEARSDRLTRPLAAR